MSRSIVARIFGVVLFLALLGVVGGFAFRAGVTQGISQAPEVASAIEQAAENGQGNPMTYSHGFGYGYPHHFGYGHHFGFFPFGICGSIFLLFFFFGVMKMIFFRGWRHGHHGWGHHKWEHGVPPHFSEWHKRAHGGEENEKPEESK